MDFGTHSSLDFVEPADGTMATVVSASSDLRFLFRRGCVASFEVFSWVRSTQVALPALTTSLAALAREDLLFPALGI